MRDLMAMNEDSSPVDLFFDFRYLMMFLSLVACNPLSCGNVLVIFVLSMTGFHLTMTNSMASQLRDEDS